MKNGNGVVLGVCSLLGNSLPAMGVEQLSGMGAGLEGVSKGVSILLIGMSVFLQGVSCVDRTGVDGVLNIDWFIILKRK